MGARLMIVDGVLQRSKEGVVHIMGTRVTDRTDLLARLSEVHEPQTVLSRADVFEHPADRAMSPHRARMRQDCTRIRATSACCPIRGISTRI